ncbi:MAG: PAS domain S-box protein, partial [Betaproteobacteria bacterium]
MATILIVDDRPTNRQFLLTLLGYGGHRLLEAANGAEALERVRAERPDLVITDILMPTMDGYEFVAHLRADPDLAPMPVIFYTATYSEPQAKALADSCGVRIVLPKPCDPERILAAVNEALGITDSAPAPSAGAARNEDKAGEPHKVDDQLAEYVNELQSVKSKFDDIVEGSVKLRTKRAQVRQLSEQFSENVMSLQRIASRLSAIIEVGMEMRNPARLVELFFAAACDIIDSKYAAIGMLDEQEQALRFIFAKGVDVQIYRDADGGRAGILGVLLQGHRPLRSRTDAGPDGLPTGHPRVRNFLGVPVASKERVYGWLFFAEKRGEGEFSEEDERLAGMMAAKLAVLYENAVLYDVIQRHATQLQIEIAERRRAEQAVRESEAKFRELIEQASDGIFVTDAQGNFKLVNPRFCEMLGYSEEALLRLSAADTYAAEEKALFAQRIADLGEIKTRLFERMMRRKDGTLFPVEMSVRRLSSGMNQGIVRDITERRKAQQALAESQAALHRAQLLAKLGHILTQPDGSFERWSDTLPQLIGVEPDRMPRSTREWLDLLHPEDRARFRSTAIEAGRKGQREEVEYRLKRADGAWIHVRQVIEPLQSQAGAEGGKRWFSTLQDVTEQKQAQEALAESEFRFRQLTENITEAFWLTDPFKSEMLYISAAYEKIWGRSCQALYASPRDWVEAIHPEDRQRVLDAAIAKQARGDYDEEYRIVRPDGSMRWIRDRAFPVSDSEGRVYRIAGVAEDITERKRAADKIRRLNRVYAVLSGIPTLIVRARDRDELFRESCTIAVEAGQFPMAWIGLVDRETTRVKPVAWGGGAEQFLASAPLSMGANRAAGRGMSGTAISEKKAMIANDIQSDSRTQMKEQCRERGINSLAFLPLIVENEGIGVLALYASEIGFFDEEEMKLLLELAGDISFALDHIEKEEKLNYLAYYDSLTGLANRDLLHERLTQSVRAASRDERKLAVIVLDIERFKAINDSFGRQAGDELLKQFAAGLGRVSGDPTRLARVGGDHFVVVLRGLKVEEEVARFYEQRLREYFAQPFRIANHDLRISAKAGIAIYPNDGSDADALLRNAEAALKKTKASGERYLFYTQQMTERIA